MMQQTDTGIGRALRRARLTQGKTLEEVSRDTRVRTDYLLALERETWGALAGDVYVRGFLRSYSRYLGLNAEKVIQVYERTSHRPKPPPAPVERAPGVGATEAVELTGGNRRGSWFLAVVAAVTALAAAAGIGLFSRRATVPEPASNRPAPQVAVTTRTVEVGLLPRGPVEVEIVPDDDPPIVERLERGEARSFEADERILVRLSQGDRVRLEVNGTDLGTPGFRDQPFEATYGPKDFRGDRSPSVEPTSGA
ncbi:MAG TPA: helix-turn-helix transcriptional regulator [Actinomycetota bacterium]|nr:helix-turn-helix transcriptional regulator [Actinomycetota bacterium]